MADDITFSPQLQSPIISVTPGLRCVDIALICKSSMSLAALPQLL